MKRNNLMLFLISTLLIITLGGCTSAGSPAPAPDSSSEEIPATDTPLPTDEPSAEGVISEAPGACNNPFYPIRSDATWNYHIVLPNQDSSQGSFSLTYENLTEESFVTVMTLRDPDTDEIFQAQGTWYCSEEGIVSSEFNTFSFVTLGDVSVETVDYDGFALLPEDQWDLTATWSTDYQVNTSFTVEEVAVTSSMSISLVNTITAIEEVSVSAGTYPEAYRVDSIGVMNLDMEGLDASQTTFPVEYSTWYVKNVGMVRQETTGESADGTFTELISVE